MYTHHHDRPHSTGAWTAPAPHAHHHPHNMHGFCQSCCHPKSMCCCHRECRKEAKELLVQSTLSRSGLDKDSSVAQSLRSMNFATPFVAGIIAPATGKVDVSDDLTNLRDASFATPIAQVSAAAADQLRFGVGTGFIGGGCCVHLSVEYTPTTPTVASAVMILVRDSEGTILAWYKAEQPGAGYQVKECVVTTKPGADLFVIVLNMTARVRWCEVFSC